MGGNADSIQFHHGECQNSFIAHHLRRNIAGELHYPRGNRGSWPLAFRVRQEDEEHLLFLTSFCQVQLDHILRPPMS